MTIGPAIPGERSRLAALGVGILALLAGLCWPIVEGKVYTLDDLSNFHAPLRLFLSRTLASGEAPWWCPDLFCGYYLHAEGQVGLAHPLQQALYRWIAVAPAFVLEVVLPMPMAALGMYFFLGRHGLARSARGLGGLVFGFGGYLVYHHVHPNSAAVGAHIPWLLLAADHLVTASARRAAARAAAAIAGLTGSQLLLGHPQTVLYSLVAEGAYLLVAVGPLSIVKRVGWGTLAKLLGLGLGAAQILPTLDLMGGSHREGLPREFAGLFSMHPANLHQWLAPLLYRPRVFAPGMELGGLEIAPCLDLGHGQARESGLYNGVIVPVMLAWCILRWRSTPDPRRLRLWAVIMAGLGLLLATGAYTPLFEITSRTPGLNLFRSPARFVLLAQLGTAALVATAFADLLTTGERPIRARAMAWLALPALAAGLLVATVHGLAGIFPEQLMADALAPVRHGLLSVGLLAAATGLATATARGHRIAAPSLILLAAADLGGHAIGQMKPGETARLDQLAIDVPSEGRSRIHVVPPRHDLSLRWLGEGRGMLNGYSALMPTRALDYSQMAALRVASVHHVLGASEIPVQDPLPWARLVSSARLREGDINTALAQLDPAREALVERPLPIEPGDAGRVEVLDDGPSSFVFRTTAPTRQLLVLSERHHPGWVVTIRARSRQALLANGEFMACVVPAGTATIRWDFRPASLRLGFRWSLLAGLGVVGLLCIRGPGLALPEDYRADRAARSRPRMSLVSRFKHSRV
jgi:hypothetical protein